MWAKGAYTTNSQTGVNTHQKRKLMRSTRAPEISAGVMIANMPWNRAKLRPGMARGSHADGRFSSMA